MDKLAREGASESELAAARTEMTRMNDLYRNVVFRFLFSLVEIVPVGFVITLISAALLRKPQFLPKNVNV